MSVYNRSLIILLDYYNYSFNIYKAEQRQYNIKVLTDTNNTKTCDNRLLNDNQIVSFN